MGLFSMAGFNRWRESLPAGSLTGMRDPSEPLSGWRQLQDRIIDFFVGTYEFLLNDWEAGSPQLKKLLLTIFLATITLIFVAKFIQATFFSYRRYIKVPIVSLDLLDSEVHMLRSPSVTTLTMYRGAAPLAIIRRRLLLIIKKNPWLTARLVLEKGKYTLKYSADWDSDSVIDHFEITEDRSLVVEMDYESIVSRITCFVIPSGAACLNKNVPLFKVAIIQNPSGFGLVLSMSHVISDGRTYYNIYGMFNGAISEVRPLIAKRVHKFTEEVRKKSKMQSYYASAAFIFRVICFVFFQPKKGKAKILQVDPKWIEAKKEELDISSKSHADETPSFVSTNDILVSWWASRIQLDHCFMAVNFRERIDRLSDDNAGNYSGVTVLYPEDYQKPRSVRAAVSKILKDIDSAPSVSATLKFNCGIVTNWSTFYSDVNFDHCTLLRHLPVFAKGNQRFPAGMVIFCTKKGELAVLIGTSSPDIAARMFSSEGEMCGDVLMNYSKYHC